MTITKTFGVIGVGNMGGAILEGLFARKLMKPGQVFVFDKIEDRAREFQRKYGVHRAASNADLVQKSEVLLLAVKPQDLEATAAEFRKALTSRHLLISILAGTPLAKISKAVMGPSPKIVRAMPNLGAKVGSAITAVTGSDAACLELACQIFSGCGETVVLEEKFFDLVTALSGSGPAYFFFLMELMTKEGVRHGLSEEQAKKLAVQTALGAAKLAGAAPESPEELRKKVTSKGGTTEAALKIFFDQQFPEIFKKVIQAAMDRGRELSR